MGGPVEVAPPGLAMRRTSCYSVGMAMTDQHHDSRATRLAYYTDHAVELDARADELEAQGRPELRPQIAILRATARDDRRTAANIERRGY